MRLFAPLLISVLLALLAQNAKAQDLAQQAPSKSVEPNDGDTDTDAEVDDNEAEADEVEDAAKDTPEDSTKPKNIVPQTALEETKESAEQTQIQSAPVQAPKSETQSAPTTEAHPIPLFADVPLPLRWQQNAAGKNPQVTFGQNGEVRSASGDSLFFHSPRTGAVTQRIKLGCSIIGLANDFVLCEKTIFRVNRFGEQTVQARFLKSATSFAVFGDDHAVVFKNQNGALRTLRRKPRGADSSAQ